ncbi:hypothetical protein L7F22_016759 [Adiantum nelumboides]|nr:hypothetical protein [Adiantum nelumboides]
MDKMEPAANCKPLDQLVEIGEDVFDLRQFIAAAPCVDAAGDETRLAQADDISLLSTGVRIVQIFSPLIVQTDPANFRSLVQQLTGKDSADFFNQKRCEAAQQASNEAEAEASASPLATRIVRPTHFIDYKRRASKQSLRRFTAHSPSAHIRKGTPDTTCFKRSHEAHAAVAAHAAALISPQVPDSLWDYSIDQSFFSDLGSVTSYGPPPLHLFDEPLYPSWAIVGDSEAM